MFRLLILCVGLAARPAGADNATNPPPALAGVAEFNAAFQGWNGERFARASERFREATRSEPGNATNFYWLGVSEFHHMLQLRSAPGHAPAAAAAQSAAQGALITAVALDAHHAESHALLATIYGIRIGERWIRFVTLGPRVLSHSQTALKEGPANPRVRYLLATGEFYTAGGEADLRQALKDLLLAETFFVREAGSAHTPLEPLWGSSSCHTFIGLTYEKLGDRARAAEYFRQSLAEHPADNLAQTALDRVTSTPKKANP